MQFLQRLRWAHKVWKFRNGRISIFGITCLLQQWVFWHISMQHIQIQDSSKSKMSTKVRLKQNFFLDNFNQNMEIIETQFRAGQISFLEPKETENVTPGDQSMVTPTTNKTPRHARKKSILVTNMPPNHRFRNASPLSHNQSRQPKPYFQAWWFPRSSQNREFPGAKVQ